MILGSDAAIFLVFSHKLSLVTLCQPMPVVVQGCSLYSVKHDSCGAGNKTTWLVTKLTQWELFTWREEDPRRWNNFILGLHAEITAHVVTN